MSIQLLLSVEAVQPTYPISSSPLVLQEGEMSMLVSAESPSKSPLSIELIWLL
jgi:hypothetical protein